MNEPEDWMDDIPDPFAEAIQPLVEQMQQMQEQLAALLQQNQQMMAQMAHVMTAPKRVVRDRAGRVIGVETGAHS